jgi:hypothetical protein
MTRLVVDSSIVIKWSIPEVHSADALRYLDPDLERDAPELLLAEISNILWKKVGRNELTRVQAELTLAPPRFPLPRLGSATRIFRRPQQRGITTPVSGSISNTFRNSERASSDRYSRTQSANPTVSINVLRVLSYSVG